MCGGEQDEGDLPFLIVAVAGVAIDQVGLQSGPFLTYRDPSCNGAGVVADLDGGGGLGLQVPVPGGVGLTATSGRPGETTDHVDKRLKEAANTEQNLQAFRAFWDHQNHRPLTHTIGCSVPTFHGSSADASAIAATGVTLAGIALQRRVGAGYLFASAHASYNVLLRTHVPLTPDEISNAGVDA